MSPTAVRRDASAPSSRAWRGERVLASTSSRAARRFAALSIVLSFSALVAVVARHHEHGAFYSASATQWRLSLLASVTLLARGVYLGRPVTSRHAIAALAMALAAVTAHVCGLAFAGSSAITAAALILVWPLSAHPTPDRVASVWPLVEMTRGDPLAPFVMQSTKCLFFDGSRSAAVAYRTCIGFAVVSGDPVGRPGAYRAVVGDFAAMCQRKGWRIIVLSAGERCVRLWRDPGLVGQSLKAIPIGRDVVVDVKHFSMTGRRYRNLRQAVSRSHNGGITTEIVAEQDISDGLRAELADVIRDSGGRYERGFSMMLDGLLERRFPGVLLIIGRDRSGRVQAFQRYVQSGAGSDVSLDSPWRRQGAPNGIDERLTVDMITWCRSHGARRLSLAFAAFPEVFAHEGNSTGLRQIYYSLIRLGDPLIKLESLYRYLLKFHALGRRRYVLVSIVHIPAALLVLLSLEFVPHRHRRW